MANLFDTIKQNLNQQSGQTAPMQDQSLKAKKLFQAKSGRAVGDDSAAPASAVGEQAANAETNAGLQQVAQAGQIENQTVQAGQEAVGQKAQEQQGLIESRRKMDTVENRVKTDQLLQGLEQNRGKMDVQKDAATKQQVAFNLRMQNQEYVDNLQRAGASSRLDNEAAFQEAMLRTELGDRDSALREKLGNDAILSDSEREFKKKMNNITLEDAYGIFKDEQSVAKKRALYSGLGQGGSAIAGMSGSSSSSSAGSSGGGGSAGGSGGGSSGGGMGGV